MFVSFEKKAKRGSYYIGLNIQKDEFTMTSKATEMIGEPEGVKILIDKENNEVKLVPHLEGFKIYYRSKHTSSVHAKLHNAGMLLGRYYFQGGQGNKDGQEYVFKKKQL